MIPPEDIVKISSEVVLGISPRIPSGMDPAVPPGIFTRISSGILRWDSRYHRWESSRDASEILQGFSSRVSPGVSLFLFFEIPVHALSQKLLKRHRVGWEGERLAEKYFFSFKGAIAPTSLENTLQFTDFNRKLHRLCDY